MMTAQEICLLVSRIAKGGSGMVGIAGQWLNLVLEDLKLNQNLKINRVTTLITVQAGSYGPFALESDYLRTYDMFYAIPSQLGPNATTSIIFLNPITMEQYDAEFKAPSISDYPYEFATDLSTQAQTWSGTPGESDLTSPGQLYIYPQSNAQLTLTHRYMRNQPDIEGPEVSPQVPWFPYTEYLITAAAAGMMGVTGDDRADAYTAKAKMMLQPHLIMQGDEQQAVQAMRLDARRFRFHTGLKPTKSEPL